MQRHQIQRNKHDSGRDKGLVVLPRKLAAPLHVCFGCSLHMCFRHFLHVLWASFPSGRFFSPFWGVSSHLFWWELLFYFCRCLSVSSYLLYFPSFFLLVGTGKRGNNEDVVSMVCVVRRVFPFLASDCSLCCCWLLGEWEGNSVLFVLILLSSHGEGGKVGGVIPSFRSSSRSLSGMFFSPLVFSLSFCIF